MGQLTPNDTNLKRNLRFAIMEPHQGQEISIYALK